jgi:hypothetical protein
MNCVLPDAHWVKLWLQEDSRTCKFIKSQEQYEIYVCELDAEQQLEATYLKGQHCFAPPDAERGRI